MATPKDEAALLTLINLVQPHVSWTREHLYWQFFNLPARQAKLYVIKDGDAIVSLYAAIPQPFWVDGRQVEAWMVQDVMTHPDFRRQGFLHHLADRCLQDIKQSGVVGYTFPNDRSEQSFRRCGWTELCEVPHRSMDLVNRHDARRWPKIERLENDFDRGADEVWDRAGLGVGLRRDRKFLNWRYTKPHNTYYRFRIDDDRGLLVLKVYSNESGRTVHILELLLREQNREVLPDILSFCLDFAARQGAESVTAWLPGSHPYAPHFDAAGLLLTPTRKRFVFVQSPPEYAGRVEDPGAWHLTQGDSDVY